jgi:hypothetical protein
MRAFRGRRDGMPRRAYGRLKRRGCDRRPWLGRAKGARTRPARPTSGDLPSGMAKGAGLSLRSEVGHRGRSTGDGGRFKPSGDASGTAPLYGRHVEHPRHLRPRKANLLFVMHPFRGRAAGSARPVLTLGSAQKRGHCTDYLPDYLPEPRCLRKGRFRQKIVGVCTKCCRGTTKDCRRGGGLPGVLPMIRRERTSLIYCSA